MIQSNPWASGNERNNSVNEDERWITDHHLKMASITQPSSIAQEKGAKKKKTSMPIKMLILLSTSPPLQWSPSPTPIKDKLANKQSVLRRSPQMHQSGHNLQRA
jgi:hypothetical protein